MIKKILMGLGILFIGLVALSAFNSPTPEAPMTTEEITQTLEDTVSDFSDSSSAETSEPAPTEEPEFTVSQENAIEMALSYIEFMSFSEKSLIDQLEYEGFSKEDSTFAVEYIEVDWFEQAARSAQEYLDLMSFSRQGLIDQLLYEGFTEEQAVYGVNQVGL